MMKKLFSRWYYWANNPKDKIDHYQQVIRDTEWKAIVGFIPEHASFLDIGCGDGYSMEMAAKDRSCRVRGIDPEPYQHGVGRNWEGTGTDEPGTAFEIAQGFGESLPFDDAEFDVVYSSHALEHAQDELTFLREARRVLMENGTLIIGMPTAVMAWINLVSSLLFTSHQRLFNFVFSKLRIGSVPPVSLKNVLFPVSHSYSDKTVFHDIQKYRVSNWRRTVSQEFSITETILPALYPFPDYIQLFGLKKGRKYGSSVFFICKNKSRGRLQELPPRFRG